MRPWFVILKQVQDDEREGNSGNYCVIPLTKPFSKKHRRTSEGWCL
jgi:hypothetical protein